MFIYADGRFPATIDCSNRESDPLEPMKDTNLSLKWPTLLLLNKCRNLARVLNLLLLLMIKWFHKTILADVVIEDEANTISGIVTSVEKNADGELKVVVNGNAYDTSLISKVSLPDA